jgi:thiamine kinase-like enzyme
MDAASPPDLTAEERLRRLPIWPAAPEVTRLSVGRTNINYRVDAGGERYFARVAADLPHHGILRSREALCASLAAGLGVAPPVVHARDGVLVQRFVDGETLRQGEPVSAARLDRIADLLRRVHEGRLPAGTADVNPVAWSRAYLARLAPGTLPPAQRAHIEAILDAAPKGALRGLIHTDLIPENFIDDGRNIWLIDWEYAGLGDPATDLANLAMNFALDGNALGRAVARHGGIARVTVDALKDAVVVREALWCLIQIEAEGLRGDLADYTRLCLGRLGLDPSGMRGLG